MAAIDKKSSSDSSFDANMYAIGSLMAKSVYYSPSYSLSLSLSSLFPSLPPSLSPSLPPSLPPSPPFPSLSLSLAPSHRVFSSYTMEVTLSTAFGRRVDFQKGETDDISKAVRLVVNQDKGKEDALMNFIVFHSELD